jgi:hypothetical protein
MMMFVSTIGRKLQASKQALNTATSQNTIEQHLALLAEYEIGESDMQQPASDPSESHYFRKR